MPNFNKFLFFIILFLIDNTLSQAQCVTVYPYVENFETTNGAWTSGGTGNSWAWGTPNKPNINSAGAGVKCWITDGLTGSSYVNCERSWVQSPCFDFTNILNPAIAMKIYWECENTYDGATFQYSTNSGVTWTNVGTNTDPVNCMNQNWFNSGNITHLGASGACTGSLASPKHGWCGNSGSTSGGCQGGNGSNGWVLAKHCLGNLGGQANVMFRFAFGAGSSCNAYEGFAFDSIAIYDAPVNVSNFSWVCNGVNTIQFSNTSTPCPTAYTWNFGDPASGASNTSTSINPTHVFTNGGTYTITVTASGPCNAADTSTQVINLLSSSVTITNINCFGNTNGVIAASATNGNGIITYGLSPGALSNTTGNFSGLLQGLYTLTVTDASGCGNTTQILITQPTAIFANIAAASTTVLCNGASTGIIVCNASGGTNPLSYTLLPTGSNNTTGSFTGLNGGNYSIVVTDAKGCVKTVTHNIISSPPILLNNVVTTNVICNGDGDASITTNATGGSGALSYLLNPIALVNSTGNFTGLSTNIYTIVVTDGNNCIATTTAQITSSPAISIIAFAKTDIVCTGEKNGNFTSFASGGTGALTYILKPNNITQTNGNFIDLAAGNYTLQITDINNCTKDTVINIAILSTPITVSITKKDIGCAGINNDGNAIAIAGGGAAPLSYSWSTIPVQTTANVSNLFTGQYFVMVKDANNCFVIDSVFINPATCCASIYFPNIFTPNNDGINDGYGVRTFINLELKTFQIFDRFGNKVWETNTLTDKWDGSNKKANCDMGTYFYFFQYKCLEDGKEYIKKGDVILTR
jgi:gliding motility-associated-like protein